MTAPVKRCMRLFLLAALCLQSPAFALEQGPGVRKPFTLTLHVDKDHYYEERYEKPIPYVDRDNIYLFSGERIGVNVSAGNDGVAEVAYQPDLRKADIELAFSQDGETAAMTLAIKNNLKRPLYMDALMTTPGKKDIFKTSIVPVGAGLVHFESWAHPIVQLVLQNLRFYQ